MVFFDYPKNTEYRLPRKGYTKSSINVTSGPDGCNLHQKAARNSFHTNGRILTVLNAVPASSHNNLIHIHTDLRLSHILT